MEIVSYLDSMFQVSKMFRIGHSRDIHRLDYNNRPLIIGGVTFNFEKGPVAHSDGDVLYHAVAESILGALCLGDLGTHFPDNDNTYLNFDSKNIVLSVIGMMKNKGYKIVNIDCNIILEKPKLKDSILKMRENLAVLLDTDIDNVSIKAQTNEKCGEVGRGEAIEATSTVLISR